MKLHFIEKIADLMTNPKSEHRVLPDFGEFRLGGSTVQLGSFELTVVYDNEIMSMTGSIGRQYVTINQHDGKYIAKFQRRQGGQVREPIILDLKNKNAFIAFMKNWVEEVIKEN